MRRHGLAALALALAALAAGGCGKETPKAETDSASERKAALERAKEGPYGAQVKALESAKGMQDDLDRKTRESVEKAEQGAK